MIFQNELYLLREYQFFYSQTPEGWRLVVYLLGRHHFLSLIFPLNSEGGKYSLEQFLQPEDLKMRIDSLSKLLFFHLTFGEKEDCEDMVMVTVKESVFFSQKLKQRVKERNKAHQLSSFKDLARIYNPKTQVNSDNINQVT